AEAAGVVALGAWLMWLFLPSTAWRSVPDRPVWSWDLALPYPAIARCATWKGKFMPLRFWDHVWQTGAWMRRLSGVTWPASELTPGVMSWIASLRDSRASRGAVPASDGAPAMPAGCGPTLRDAFASWQPAGSRWSFSKTCPGSSTVGGSAS